MEDGSDRKRGEDVRVQRASNFGSFGFIMASTWQPPWSGFTQGVTLEGLNGSGRLPAELKGGISLVGGMWERTFAALVESQKEVVALLQANALLREQLARAQAGAGCGATGGAPQDEPKRVTTGVNTDGGATDTGDSAEEELKRSQHELEGRRGRVEDHKRPASSGVAVRPAGARSHERPASSGATGRPAGAVATRSPSPERIAEDITELVKGYRNGRGRLMFCVPPYRTATGGWARLPVHLRESGPGSLMGWRRGAAWDEKSDAVRRHAGLRAAALERRAERARIMEAAARTDEGVEAAADATEVERSDDKGLGATGDAKASEVEGRSFAHNAAEVKTKTRVEEAPEAIDGGQEEGDSVESEGGSVEGEENEMAGAGDGEEAAPSAHMIRENEEH